MKQNVCDYILNFLADQGIKEVFEVYGAANANLIDAFTRTDRVRYVATMHEQAAGFAAEGYAKVSHKPGVAIATSGPGAQNLLTPIGNCFYDSVPCLFLVGQIKSQFIRPDPSVRQVGFQETPIVEIVSSITKYAKQVRNAKDIRYELEKAWFLCQEGRPGPVLLDMPIDVQKEEIDPDELFGFDPEVEKTVFDMSFVNLQIDTLIEDLERSKRPVILVGGGVWIANAVQELLAVAGELKIPCLPTFNALDIVTSDFKFYGGRIGTNGSRAGNFALQNSDLLLAVGCRISGRITGGNLKTFARGAKKYVVDVDPALLQRKLQQIPLDVNIRCDAKTFLMTLLQKFNESGLRYRHNSHPHHQWMQKVDDWKIKYHPTKEKLYGQKTDTVNPYVFMKKLSDQMCRDDIFVYDCGGNVIITNAVFETKQGQRFITNNGNSPMGFSFAGAMGAWFASDKKRQNVICVIGDGGFNMNIQEIQTCLNYGIGIKVFILNNHIYGITKSFQITNFGGRMEACGPKGYQPPDFRKVIGLGYEAPLETVDCDEESDKKIKRVLNSNGLVFCDVNCHEWHTYGPKIIGWNTPIEDMFPYLPRDEFKEQMIIDLVPGWENPFTSVE